MDLETVKTLAETIDKCTYQELEIMDSFIDKLLDELFQEEQEYIYDGRKDSFYDKLYTYSAFVRRLNELESLSSVVRKEMESKNKD